MSNLQGPSPMTSEKEGAMSKENRVPDAERGISQTPGAARGTGGPPGRPPQRVIPRPGYRGHDPEALRKAMLDVLRRLRQEGR